MTRMVTSALGPVLTIVAIMSIPTSPGGLTAAAEGAAQASSSDRAMFVGTYRLITIEVKDTPSGEWVERPNFNSIGYITYATPVTWACISCPGAGSAMLPTRQPVRRRRPH